MRSAPQNKLWGADVTLPPAAPFGFPSQVCAHGRRRDRCKACQGKSFCEHGRARNRCKECGGSQICEHKRIRQYCKECGGSQTICEHDRVRYHCKQCKKECIGGSKRSITKQKGKGKGKRKAHSRSSSATRQAASTYTAGVHQSTRGSDRPRKSYKEDSGSELDEEEHECAVVIGRVQTQVVGWLDAHESDFLDSSGMPDALYRVRYLTGRLAGDEDLQESELLESMPPRKVCQVVVKADAEASPALDGVLEQLRSVRFGRKSIRTVSGTSSCRPKCLGFGLVNTRRSGMG